MVKIVKHADSLWTTGSDQAFTSTGGRAFSVKTSNESEPLGGSGLGTQSTSPFGGEEIDQLPVKTLLPPRYDENDVMHLGIPKVHESHVRKACGGCTSCKCGDGGRPTDDQIDAHARYLILPDHDYTQHSHRKWGAVLKTAASVNDTMEYPPDVKPQGKEFALDENLKPYPNLKAMTNSGKDLGSHHSQVFNSPSGMNWLVKPTGSSSNFLADGDVATSKLQAYSGLPTPPTFKVDYKGKPASAQLMFGGAKDAYPDKQFDPESVNDADLLTLQKHHALDWMTGNHDAHGGQFIRTPDGQLIGIDKGQAFKHFNHDRLHWRYHPNGKGEPNHPYGSGYGEVEPVYNTLFRNYANGGRELLDPREGELGQFIQHLQDIPDEDYRTLLADYAGNAANAGSLGLTNSENPRFHPNEPHGFLDYAVQRKNSLMEDLAKLYDKAKANRMMGRKVASEISQLTTGLSDGAHSDDLIPEEQIGGSRSGDTSYRESLASIEAKIAAYTQPSIKEIEAAIAKLADMPPFESMQPAREQPSDLGSHGASLYSGNEGDWLIKPAASGLQFLPKLDDAVGKLQSHVGLEAPETHAVSTPSGLATAVKWNPSTTPAFETPTLPSATELSPQDRMTLQKHNAFDWMIANHDSHAGNWLRDQNTGGLIGIDKGQALKYFGRDRLDPQFHPNFYAREPVYNQMWRDHAHNIGEPMSDPREGELGQFVQSLQNIPDEHLRKIFAPYAREAAREGVLALGANKDHPMDPRRKLSDPAFAPNDPEAFLGALLDRKNHLSDQLGEYYDKMSAIREQNALAPGSVHIDNPQEAQQKEHAALYNKLHHEPDPDFDPKQFAHDYLSVLPSSASSLGSGHVKSPKARKKLLQLIEMNPGTQQTQQLKKLYLKHFAHE